MKLTLSKILKHMMSVSNKAPLGLPIIDFSSYLSGKGNRKNVAE